jgi:hypothetical protein
VVFVLKPKSSTHLANVGASCLFSRGDNFKACVLVDGSQCGVRKMTLHESYAGILAVVVVVIVVLFVENVRWDSLTLTMQI